MRGARRTGRPRAGRRRDAVGLGLALGVAAPATAQELVIGVIAPLTGSKAEQGMQFKEGAELAVADLNKAGGVLGRQCASSSWTTRGSRRTRSPPPRSSPPTGT